MQTRRGGRRADQIHWLRGCHTACLASTRQSRSFPASALLHLGESHRGCEPRPAFAYLGGDPIQSRPYKRPFPPHLILICFFFFFSSHPSHHLIISLLEDCRTPIHTPTRAPDRSCYLAVLLQFVAIYNLLFAFFCPALASFSPWNL